MVPCPWRKLREHEHVCPRVGHVLDNILEKCFTRLFNKTHEETLETRKENLEDTCETQRGTFCKIL